MRKNIIHISLQLTILIFLFFSSLTSCNEKGKHSIAEDEIDSYLIVRCPPKKTDSIKTYNIVEYSVPEFLMEYLDTVISEEINCRCYKNSKMNGFLLHSLSETSDTLALSIVSNNMNIVGNYSNSTGFFKYKGHYFICSKAFSHLPLKEIRKLTVMAFLPDKRLLNYEPETTWRLNYYDNKIISIKHYPCPSSH